MQDSEELRHQRFGHLGKNLRLLQERKLVKGMNFIHAEDQEVCVSFVTGKQTKTPFPKEQAIRATKVLKIVHSDACGPMKAKSLGGNSYFVTFIDDKSRYAAIYSLERKDQLFIKFLEYEAMVENLTGEKIKVSRTDNGVEYFPKTLSDYLKQKGTRPDDN